MKKIFTIMLAILLCLSALTGCVNKINEDQQTMEEIRQHMLDEAAADGVDLQAMLEQEAAESLARTESREQKREARKNSREELDAYYNPLLQDEYDEMIAAVTPEETKAHGERYNELINERNNRGMEVDVSWSGRSSYLHIDDSYISKAMFLSAKEYGSYDEYTVFHTGKPILKTDNPDTLLLVYTRNNDTGNLSELVFIHEDFSVCRLFLSDYFDPDTYFQITDISKSYVELCTPNSDYIHYLFDISGSEAFITENSTDYSDEQYRSILNERIPYEERMSKSYEYEPHWDDSLEELNKMIIKNSEFGAASNPYL